MDRDDHIRSKREKHYKRDISLLALALLIFIGSAIYAAYEQGMQRGISKVETSQESLHEMEQALMAANKEYKQTDQRLKKIEGDYEEALKMTEEKQQLKQEIKKLQEEEKALKHRISTLNDEKKSQEEQLKLLQQKIDLNKENTIYLPAGGFTVGSDLPPGKYIVKPHGGNGNFLVNNGSKANIMLGERSESIYLEEYMLEFEKGDTIGTSLPTKYIPVINEDE